MATLNIKNFPEALYGRLQARAEREHRSLSQEVVHLLSRAVEEPEVRSLLELKGLGKELWRGIDADQLTDGVESLETLAPPFGNFGITRDSSRIIGIDGLESWSSGGGGRGSERTMVREPDSPDRRAGAHLRVVREDYPTAWTNRSTGNQRQWRQAPVSRHYSR